MFANFFASIVATLKTFQIKDLFDIIIVGLIIYYLFRLIRETRSAQLVKGIIILLIAYLISAIFNLTMINFILKSVFEFAVIILVVVFQPEIRKILENIGKRRFTKSNIRNFVNNNLQDLNELQQRAISDVCDSAILFSHQKTGALYVFERQVLLTEICETGTIINAETSASLFGNIFYNKAPLHDGACIIRDGKLYAAGVILPLSKRVDLAQKIGTRHRAAIGISEDSDAIAVVVSEETGAISLAVRGELKTDLNRDKLYRNLCSLLLPDEQEKDNLFTMVFKSNKKEGE